MRKAIVNGTRSSSGWTPSRTALRIPALSLVYAAALLLSLFTSYLVRFDFQIPEDHLRRLPSIIWWVLVVKLAMLFLFRQEQILPSIFNILDIKRLLYAMVASSSVIAAASWFLVPDQAVPRGVILIDFLLSLVGLVLIRLALRFRRERLRVANRKCSGTPSRRVGIIGAGEVGANLAAELRNKPGLGLIPVAFFDDDPTKWGARVYDIPILGGPELLLTEAVSRLRVDEFIISIPSALPQRKAEIVRILQKSGIKFRTVPSLVELALGKVQVSHLRSVEVGDLLGRVPIEIDSANIRHLLAGQTVMVTGAGGSIGSELCRQVSGFDPERLLLVERSEVQMFAIEQELKRSGFKGQVVPLVADLLDGARMKVILERYRPKILFHAAAHKHVSLMESQPGEAIRNNALGTARLAELAIAHDVERFVLISTDKAINPTSVMGATKRLAEMFLQSLHAAKPGKTRLMAVRFGNVLGSSGSVIPIFKDQIARGGPVTVTDPAVTRYFMTIPEAVGLVLQSAALGTGGEVFLLDMGKPVKIVDLARQLILLSGLEPDKDIKIEFVGLQPGEKLYEELNYEQESLIPTNHPKVRRFCAQASRLDTMQQILEEFAEILHDSDPDHCKLLLKQAVPEYTPSLSKGFGRVPVSERATVS